MKLLPQSTSLCLDYINTIAVINIENTANEKKTIITAIILCRVAICVQAVHQRVLNDLKRTRPDVKKFCGISSA